MKHKNLIAIAVIVLSFAFAIIFNNTTSWTLFFILIPIYLLCFVLISRGVKVNIKETSVSGSAQESLTVSIESKDLLKTLNLDAHITDGSFSLPLIMTSPTNSINHELIFFNKLTRGLYNNCVMFLNITDPFGLITKRIDKVPLNELTIYPQKRIETALLIVRSLTQYINSKHHFGLESDYSIDTISTYKPNDPIKNIHWKLSSKTDETYTKHYNRFLKSTLNLALNPNHSKYFELSVSLFYSLAIQDTYKFKDILYGEKTIKMPNEIHKFATITDSKLNPIYNRDTLIVTSVYLSANMHCMQLVVNEETLVLYGEKKLELLSMPLDGGPNYE